MYVSIVEKIMVPVSVNILPLHMFLVLILNIIKYLILFITKLSTYVPSFYYSHIFFLILKYLFNVLTNMYMFFLSKQIIS